MEFKVEYERLKVRKNVTSNIKYDLDDVWLDDAIKTLQDYKAELQEKGFVDLMLSINTVNGYYDDHHIEIFITGAEFETDKDYERRIKAQEKTAETMRIRKEKQEAQAAESERKLYEKLKKKFEKSGQA